MRIVKMFLVPVLLGLAACGGRESAPASSSPAEGMRNVVDAAAAKLPPADAALQPGQSVQGVIEADVGRGAQSFRSLATKVADDIGEQVDARLGTREGRKAIEDANRALGESGAGQKVDAADVRAIVGGMAGKTFHDSDVRRVDIIGSLQVSLSGKAADGGKLDIALTFDDASLALTRASLGYRPDAKSMFESYETTKDAPPQVTIERFGKNADGTYAIAGSFRTTDVPAARMAKKLAGQTLPQAEGRFDFSALPLKTMPKIGQ